MNNNIPPHVNRKGIPRSMPMMYKCNYCAKWKLRVDYPRESTHVCTACMKEYTQSLKKKTIQPEK